MYSDPPSSSDSESHLLAENEDFPPNRNGRRAVVSWFWIANGIVLLANISVFLSLYTVRDRHLRRLSPDYTIAGEVATKYEKLQLHGDFGFKSLYKGTPNPELDQAWEALGSGGMIRIEEADFKRLNKSHDDAAKFTHKQGGGYMASVEVYHQLHCLDMVRKFTYKDYYQDKDPMFRNFSEEKIIEHKDHCIDILRQFLQCSGDVGIITYHRIDGRNVPMPDFSTWHTCRNYQAIVDWVEDRKVVL